MDKWEYLSTTITWDHTERQWVSSEGTKTTTIQEFLNSCGKQGWEMVAFAPDRYTAGDTGGNQYTTTYVTQWAAFAYRAMFKRHLP
jgi:hypothetical protein